MSKTENIEDVFRFLEGYIQRKLDYFFSKSTVQYALDNVYIFNWESDKLIKTRSGLIYEFEIKTSKSDYRHDYDKKDRYAILEGKEVFLPSYETEGKKYESKYGLDDKFRENYLIERFKKPNYFYYAVPEGLIDVPDIPEWAGLVYFLPEEKYVNRNGDYCFNGFYVVKRASRLHDVKYTDEELDFCEKFYYRMLKWKNLYLFEKDRSCFSEKDKMSYSEMSERMEKAEKENISLLRSGNMMKEIISEDDKIIKAYRKRMRELIVDFDCAKFENDLFET